MNLKEIVEKSIASKEEYAQFEKTHYGREWTQEEIYVALVSDIGDLGRLVLSKEGVENIADVEKKLKHELGECLWGIAALAGKYNIDLEDAFLAQLHNVKKITTLE
jgi:NTP pyrophosphatase (non-canonical NTP hydrolase)